MSSTPPESGPGPLSQNNVWSARRVRRRHQAALESQAEAAAEYDYTRERSPVFFAMGALVLAGILAAVLWHFTSNSGDSAEKPAPGSNSAAIPEKWHGALPREAAEHFFAAKTNEERLRWVRSPELAAPLMAAFFGTGPGSGEKMSRLISQPPPALGTPQPVQELARFAVQMEDGKLRLLSLVATPEGAKVDFHSYIRHTSVPWTEILDGSEKSAEVRVIIGGPGYYEAPFDSKAEWLDAAAACPDILPTLRLYVRRGTPEAAAVEAAIAKAPQRVTVTIAPVGDSWRQHQFQITAFHFNEWLGLQGNDNPPSK